MAFENYSWFEELGTELVALRLVLVDVAGDLEGGILLSQIYYWHSKNSKGRIRLRVKKGERYWLAKGYDEWFAECHIKARTAQRKLKQLEKKGIIDLKIFKFKGAPTTHIALNWDKFNEEVNRVSAAIRAGKNADVSEHDSPSSSDNQSQTKGIVRDKPEGVITSVAGLELEVREVEES